MKFLQPKRLALKVGLASACSALALSLGVSSAIAAPTVKLRLASALPADQHSSFFVWYERFQANLNAATNNAIEVTYFGNGMLGKEADAAQQVRLGGVDMMISGTSIWATLAPEIGVLDLGYLFYSYDHVGRVLDGKAGELLADSLLKKANAKILGYGYSFGARNVYSKKQIKAPSDLQGVKIRVLPTPNFIAAFKAMGATPVPMPFGEVYSGLQMGVIEGLEQDAANVLDAKFYEVAKFCTLTQHVFAPLVMVMNPASFDKIPAEYKPVVLKAAKEATEFERTRAVEAEVRAFDELKKRGVTVGEIDRDYFRKAVKPVWADFLKRYPDMQVVVDASEAAKK